MSSKRPNVVFILADDMGYGDVSCLNPAGKIRTPCLDRLAGAGMAFCDAHASSAVCTPSRYSLLTGRYNWRSWLKEGVTFGYDRPVIEAGRMTVASFLKSHGYATACFGKWHLGWSWQRENGSADSPVDFSQAVTDGPTARGFDSFFGISASLDMPPYVYVENDRATAIPDRD
ncbi:MAG TPA: sulfatase-like hydrolase/transferase, partial [Lentisphaeria bacterium]|nr:sulfatase-like hydrolase/transferase [Lentisphaeria bacterium]